MAEAEEPVPETVLVQAEAEEPVPEQVITTPIGMPSVGNCPLTYS